MTRSTRSSRARRASTDSRSGIDWTASSGSPASDQPRPDRRDERRRAPRRLAAPLQDHGVPRLDRERRDLRHGIGTRLEDDRQDAERAGDLLQDEAVVEERPGEDAPGRILEPRDGADAVDHPGELLRVEPEPREERLRHLAARDERLGVGDVGRVRRQDRVRVRFEAGGDRLERGVLRRRTRAWRDGGRRPSRPPRFPGPSRAHSSPPPPPSRRRCCASRGRRSPSGLPPAPRPSGGRRACSASARP